MTNEDNEFDFAESILSCELIAERCCENMEYAQHLFSALYSPTEPNKFIRHTIEDVIMNNEQSLDMEEAMNLVNILYSNLDESKYIDWFEKDMNSRFDFVHHGLITEQIRKDIEETGWFMTPETKAQNDKNWAYYDA